MALSDSEYSRFYSSLQVPSQENHVCTRQCEFKQVFGNMWYCCSSGQAHVCDQNCNQRIFYDNHHDICRLSHRIFPRTEASMADAPKKRTGEEVEPAQAKRPQSADWQQQQQQQQQVLMEQQQAAAAAQQQQQQALLGAGFSWQPPAQVQQGWTAC